MKDFRADLESLAGDYFTFMLNNRTRLREFVGNFQIVLTKPRNNTNEILRLCSEFNRFRMEPLADKIPLLDEKSLDILDDALLGKLKGFSIDTILKHECYEHMRATEEKSLVVPKGPVLIRGLVPL